ncbi:hypothetical protein PFLUV_G00050920 [Perca fluviatilis]|uniref:H15 domain-containing protein n=1 Tax=Perca fluviatilis TaxID=8168 RepID=A0A6A5FH18_PERFL|nr:hypothetical protein PFLUV_G00050920 [Perca fluviatilis]
MAEVAPAASPAKAAKKKVSKPKKAGPSVSELIVQTVAASKERSGVSAAALKKALAAGGYDVDKNKARVKTAIKSLTKGAGASGSFKMNKKAVDTKAKKPVKKVAPKAKKPAATAKKPAAAKKSLKKAKKAAAVKKAAKSSNKATKSPKKVIKKAPAAKKAPAKKVGKPKVKKAAPKKK